MSRQQMHAERVRRRFANKLGLSARKHESPRLRVSQGSRRYPPATLNRDFLFERRLPLIHCGLLGNHLAVVNDFEPFEWDPRQRRCPHSKRPAGATVAPGPCPSTVNSIKGPFETKV